MARNPFTIDPGPGPGSALSGLASLVSKYGEEKKREEAKKKVIERFAEIKSKAQGAFQSDDLDAMADLALEYPEMSQALQRAAKFKSDATEKNYMDSLFRAYQNPTSENIQEVVTERQGVLQGEGVTPVSSQETDTFMDRFSENPEGTRKMVGMELAFRYPQKWKSLQSLLEVPDDLKTDRIKEFEYAQKNPAFAESFEKEEQPTGNQKDFQYYQSLLRDAPDQAKKFATQAGITPGQDDRTTAIKEFEYSLKRPDFALYKQKKKGAEDIQKKKDKVFTQATGLRKEFLTQSKDYQKVRDSYVRVKGSIKDPSPAGDLSLIFNYMKMLDPGSVVRESEFAQAAATGSYGERMKAAAAKIMRGERLSVVMRKDFVSKAKVLMNGMKKQHRKREGNYKRIAENNKLPVGDVVVDINIPEVAAEISEIQEPVVVDEGPADLPGADRAPAPAAAIEYLEANPQNKDQFRDKYGYLPENFSPEPAEQEPTDLFFEGF